MPNATAPALFEAALTAHRAGRLDEADLGYRRTMALAPGHADAYNNRGVLLNVRGRRELAAGQYRRALAARPGDPGAHYNLGNVQRAAGRLDEAAASYRAALRLRQGWREALCNLGLTRFAQNRHAEAAALMGAVLVQLPAWAEVENDRALALQGLGRLAAAQRCHRRALVLRPDYLDARLNLGVALQAEGRVAEAEACYRAVLAARPEHRAAFSNLLLCLNYSDGRDAMAVAAEHRAWAARFAAPLRPDAAYASDRDPDRRLRIGYVSGDLWQHPVSCFVAPLLQAHDRAAVEAICYADVAGPDAVTARLQRVAAGWRSIVGLSDAQVAELVRADRIDLLVDLAGHTGGNRLLLFARKPAPVQISWLGYPNTTGMTAIDYRLTDAVADPPGLADRCHAEQLIRLPAPFLCYRPPVDQPVAPAPCAASGRVTFGSFNNPAKLSPATVAMWAAILRACPDAGLVLKGRPLGDPAVAARWRARFAAERVAPEQIEIVAWQPALSASFDAYAAIDAALDPLPYCGTTTTCDALWMGVPVVTLAGDRHAARVGATLLHAVGLDDLVADTSERYVEIAVGLARDPARLQRLRAELRARMAASPLMDAPRFARKVEAAYRAMWQSHCRQG